MMAVDPTDDCTFWYTQEYYTATSTAGWQTRVGSFKFPNCSPTTLTVSPSSVAAGSSVTASWTTILNPTTGDWIGLYAPGGADTGYVSWQFTGGAASGSVSYGIPLSLSVGLYELRLFSNNSYNRLATSNAITATSPPPPTLSASPSTVAAGSSLTATWNGIAKPTTGDWLGLFATGAADTNYASWQFTSGTASGNVSYSIPLSLSVGTYELRLFSNNGYNRLATSNAITVTSPPPPTLSVSPATVAAGTSLTATWSGIANPSNGDWIGLYVPGTANTSYLSWRFTAGTSSGSVQYNIPVSLKPGTYELRLFGNNSYQVLATSNQITVT